MGTMLDPKKDKLDDFTVKDPAGKIIKEPHVPMLIEELKVRTRALSLSLSLVLFFFRVGPGTYRSCRMILLLFYPPVWHLSVLCAEIMSAGMFCITTQAFSANNQLYRCLSKRLERRSLRSQHGD